MSNRARGNILVAIQFALIAALVLIPRGSAWVLPEQVRIVALIAIALGVLAASVALVSLGKSLSANPVPVEAGRLKTSGVFAIVRHPIYSGIMVGALGYVAFAQSWLSVIAAAALFALFFIKARFEEKLLREKYPAYDAYAARVGRFVPGVGRINPQP
jgi:protein-S-isoprenylcysteine O-methyltransferase Ste14